MNVSTRWLREIAPGIRETPDALADRLGMLGAPVEAVERPGAGLDDIVVARVLSAGKHPNADRLSLCEVDPGTGEPLQVVCGAPTVVEGALYPFAPVGASLPGGMQIRKAKIRGETSNGMLCSERELGLGRAHEGIMRLPDALQLGARLVDALGLDDVRLTLEVTPNRPDLLSHVGVARELAPDGHHGIQLPPFPDGDSTERTDATMPPLDLRRADQRGVVAGVRVDIDDPAGCPRYMAAVIEGVEVRPSPDWLSGRLRAIGQRPINNIVDATNYVLHELGQPLHAFDADRLERDAIVVRRAAQGETIVTLDDVERKLDASMLVIADGKRPVAVAGVMGGAASEVGPDTTRVLLECAFFDPRTVRATARALGLSTDASYRFERGVDRDGMARALHRTVELVQALAGGDIREEALDVYPSPAEAPIVRVRPSRVERVLGERIPADEIQRMLEHLGFELHEAGDDALAFAIPGFRAHDVTREVDLIEEVARRYGYERFGEELRPYRPNSVPEAPLSGLEDRLRVRLAGRGLLETRSVPMAPERAGSVALERPLSAEEGMLRSTLAHGLLRAVELNQARGVRDVRLFEIGTTFHPTPPSELPEEQTRVAAVLTGRRRPPHWTGESADWDLWDARGLLEEVARDLGLDGSSVVPLSQDPGSLALPQLYREGVTFGLRAGDALVGIAGEVAAAAIDAPAWGAPVFALEVRLTDAMAEPRRPVLEPVPTRPASDRDLALLVPDSLPAADVEATIMEAAGPLLESLSIFDVYTGKGVAAGVRSIAFRLVFRDPERTLKDEEVDAAVGRVLQRLEDAHGVERRG
ncbi:MAG TPA: phenylalanine--tRNA ligase subunit beta [Longimicrobiales bacterium]|nr:phenylalanine--tRNA ligase subunit beta [Longimicrobiales bacterium]